MTNSDLIKDALGLIGVLNEIQEPSAEQATHGLRMLNGLMAAWQTKGLDLQYYPQTSATDETPIPDHRHLVVTYYLAFGLAPSYGRQVTQEMRALAAELYDDLVKDAVNENMQESTLDSLPGGYVFNINTG